LWERIKTEQPPKLPCELRGSIRKFFGQLWDLLKGVEPEPEPIYVFLSREDVEKEVARKYDEAQKECEAEALAEEKKKLEKRITKRDEEPIKVEVDPNLF